MASIYRIVDVPPSDRDLSVVAESDDDAMRWFGLSPEMFERSVASDRVTLYRIDELLLYAAVRLREV